MKTKQLQIWIWSSRYYWWVSCHSCSSSMWAWRSLLVHSFLFLQSNLIFSLQDPKVRIERVHLVKVSPVCRFRCDSSVLGHICCHQRSGHHPGHHCRPWSGHVDIIRPVSARLPGPVCAGWPVLPGPLRWHRHHGGGHGLGVCHRVPLGGAEDHHHKQGDCLSFE